MTYHGTVNGTRIALAHMRPRGQGNIVNVCSAIAFHGLPLMSSYAGAKAAVRAFGQAIRGELQLERSSIRVSTVFPAAINTPFFSRATSYMGWPAPTRRNGLPAGGRRAGPVAGGRQRPSGNGDQRHGDDIRAGDPHHAGPDRLVRGTAGDRPPSDPRSGGLSALRADIVCAVSARVRRAWPLRTPGTAQERASLVGTAAEGGNESIRAAPTCHGSSARRSIAAHTLSIRAGSTAERFAAAIRRFLT